MSDVAYERDPLARAERQAALLRCLSAGERGNEAIDWPHVIEEVRDVGLSELRACQSLLQQAMTHLLTRHALPGSPSAAHWDNEASVLLDDAARRFAPSMRQRLDLDVLYARALRRAEEVAGGATRLPHACPFTVDALLAGDVTALLDSVARTV